MRKLLIAIAIAIPSFSFAGPGRYQLVQLGVARADQFLLDTETGKIWRSMCGHQSGTNNCDYEYWEPMDVMGVSATQDEVFQKIKAKSFDPQKYVQENSKQPSIDDLTPHPNQHGPWEKYQKGKQ